MAISKARGREGESYFVSMTDMMVGLLFVFLILLMYFALQYRNEVKTIQSADDTRIGILEGLQKSLKDQGVEVSIDEQTGVLRLPDQLLFNSGETTPKPEGVIALEKLAMALEDVIPCYAYADPPAKRPDSCPPITHTIELLYIEGHTDSTPIKKYPINDNWDLSYQRAKNTRLAISAVAPVLEQLRNAPRDEPGSAPILTHVGHADMRPIANAQSIEQNRRIDLRITMAKPRSVSVSLVEASLGSRR
jgi:chemotaxis protein MotB